ncbi:MAG TPA: diadenylate cyclase CdaA, partial [Candidatus Eremiobacteraceae bacterium]|nr:diadenylate cyclase CdaA [Candidatus Eremiobacteraceae bacterium]
MQLPHIAFTWYDALDIVLTAYIVYVVLLLIRGTRAIQILQGVAIVLVLRLIAEYLHLWTVFSILDGLLIASGVAIPIVFQPELRRALAHLGTGGFVEGRAAHGGIASADVVCAVLGRSGSVLSERGVGAIFVVERGTGLEEYVESGRVLDARLSSELVLSLFTPKAPLHDGAIIIRGERVAAAGCFLPLSDNANLTPVMGTRHRAALGITEQTDAVAMLVSEETGDVELAVGGVIVGCGSSADAIASALRPLLS